LGKYYREFKSSAKESIGYYELKYHKPWFEKECSKLLDQRKKAKLQCLQNTSKAIRDNLNNVRPETSGTFKNRRSNYLKDKSNVLEVNNKNKSISGLHVEANINF
jgi:hypothetical protein